METELRRWMRLLEDQATVASAFIHEVEVALPRFEGHVQISMNTTDVPTEVWIDHISATPMRAGWGSKALTMICDLASARRITLALEIKQDEDDWGSDDDTNDEDGDDDKPPSSEKLVDLYSTFGFEMTEQTRYDRTAMIRHP